MRVTPDGRRYLNPVRARPFHYRWLIPSLCGLSERRWKITAYLSGLLFTAGVAAYSGSWWAAALVLTFPGVIRVNVLHPVLVDLPAMAVAIWAAVCVNQGWWAAAIGLALLAGTVKESAPVFAALWAWNPLLLIGLLPVAVRHLQPAGQDCLDTENAWILEHPFRASWKYHRPLPAWVWVLPWGAGLAGFIGLCWQGWVCVAVAYGQCLLATDTVRLYQWAAPVVASQAAMVVSPAWWPVLIVVSFVNPFRSEGF